MINGMNIYYDKKVESKGKGLKPISEQKADGLKPISNKKTASGLKPIKGGSCKKLGRGLVILK